jgi:hypothetical protein
MPANTLEKPNEVTRPAVMRNSQHSPSAASRKWHCARLPFVFGTRYANYYQPGKHGSSHCLLMWLPLLGDRLATQTIIAYPQVRGRIRKTVLDSYPSLGLQGESLRASSAVRWSILPLRTQDLSQLGSVETKKLVGGDYVPFLSGTVLVFLSGAGVSPRFSVRLNGRWLLEPFSEALC